MNITTIKNDSNFILYELPAGKPDPYAPCTLETLQNDTRKRVLQKAQKGPTCAYYALNTIRFRYGKNISSELQKERDIEKIFSERRKKISILIENKLFFKNKIKNDKDKFVQLNLDYARNIFKNDVNTNELLRIIFKKNEIPIFIRNAQSFLQQNEYLNFYDYSESLLKENLYAINKECFKKFRTSPKELCFKLHKKECPLINSKLFKEIWKTLNLLEKTMNSDYCFYNLAIELYGLKISTWNHTKPFNNFLNTLKLEGPMVVSGFFGEHFYTERPTIKESVEGFSIYGWRPGTRKEGKNGHMITLIGAQKYKNQELVYYLDPNDASDPDNPKERKIYKISYNSLINHILLNGKKPTKKYFTETSFEVANVMKNFASITNS